MVEDMNESRKALDFELLAAGPLNMTVCIRKLVNFLREQKGIHDELQPMADLYLLVPQTSTALLNRSKNRVDWFSMNVYAEAWKEIFKFPLHGTIKWSNLKTYVDIWYENLSNNYLLTICVCKLLIETGCPDNYGEIANWAFQKFIDVFNDNPEVPEWAFVEAAGYLDKFLPFLGRIGSDFYEITLSSYGFSSKLWKAYIQFVSKTGGDPKLEEEKAKTAQD